MKWKKLRLLLAAAAITALSSQAYAQGYVDDALRVSQPSLNGTTRTLSLGGTFSSLGGDIGALNSNPAGLGFFRKSDIAITPQFNYSEMESTYFMNKMNAHKQGYNLQNFGIVFAHSSPEADKGLPTENRMVSFAFGAGYSRNDVFNRTTTFGGHNGGLGFNSLLSQQANASGINGQDYSSSLAGIAYDEYLINPTNKAQTTFAPVQAGNVDQSGTLQEKGYTDNSNLSFGANFGNFVYIGAGVNFVNLGYQRQTDFNETGISDPAGKIDGLTYTKYTSQTGNGINGKAGIIFNFANALHIGGYVESPTNYNMYESSSIGLYGLKNNQLVGPSVNSTGGSGSMTAGTYDPYVSTYNTFHIRTPYKFTSGASLIVGRFMLLTADADYIDYRQTHFTSSDQSGDMMVNNGIKEKYKAVMNYRAGAEVKLGPLVFRAGYAYYPSPMMNASMDADRKIATGGFGIRSGNFYIDFGAMRDFSRSYRNLYTLSDGSGPSLKQYNIRSSGSVTIGTRF